MDRLHLSPERRLTLLGLMSVAFFTTCGGPFGLEPLPGVRASMGDLTNAFDFSR